MKSTLLLLLVLHTLVQIFVGANSINVQINAKPNSESYANVSTYNTIQYNEQNQSALISFAQFVKRMLMKLEQEVEAAIFTEIGLQAELLGVVAVYFGYFVKHIGALYPGRKIYEFGIATVALGESLRKWYDPSVTSVKSSGRFPSTGGDWNIVGDFYMINRLNIEAYYENRLN